MKKLLVLALVMLGIFSFYYFGIIAPQQREWLMKVKCKDLGEKFAKKFEANQIGSDVLSSEYTYSKKLDTCIYAGESFAPPIQDKYPAPGYRKIINIFSNQILYENVQYPGQNMTEVNLNYEKYLLKKKEFFDDNLSESEQDLLNQINEARK